MPLSPMHLYPQHGEDIVPDDAMDDDFDGLFVGTGGTLRLKLFNDTGTVDYKNIPDGSFVPLHVKAVFATGTTADDIVGLRFLASEG